MIKYLVGILVCTPVYLLSQTPSIKITAYSSIIHPIATFSSDGNTVNFKDYYVVGFPTGINFWKSSKAGFSFEVTPMIKAQNGTSQVSYFLFHPGFLLALGKGYGFAERLAFETSGRYGFTSIFSKIIVRNKSFNLFVAVPLPVRFGNQKSMSFSPGIQLGIGGL